MLIKFGTKMALGQGHDLLTAFSGPEWPMESRATVFSCTGSN